MEKIDEINKSRVYKMRQLLSQEFITAACEAAVIGQSILYDTIGGSHPLMKQLGDAILTNNFTTLTALSNGVIGLFEQGALISPRLTIAGEIESEILDIAQEQVQASETNTEDAQVSLRRSVAVFLAGAALEDALRRLCDAHGIEFESRRSTISKLQSKLYAPSAQIEIISPTENKQITAWGDSRNKADHGHFSDISHTEALTMIMGVRAFIEKHLP